MKSLQNKVAIVTGGSRGIGAEISLSLAKAGTKVVVNYVKNQSTADQICQEIIQNGGECLAVKADVSSPTDVAMLFDQAIAHFGRVDILINNAGILIFKPIADISDEEFK
ncbi:MAG: SDR family NAD(P)-dependent oxidoreductase, partial [Nitrosomonas sp.]|nr:SDR family NAD(P)-dependent oxidoreductase [Nitrosomonas sp.]